MSSNAVAIRRAVVAAATAAATASAAFGLHSEGSRAAGTVALSLTSASDSQKMLASKKKLPVSVTSSDKTVTSATVTATLTRGSTVTTLASGVKVSLSNGKGSASLKVGSSGLKSVAKCDPATITVSAAGASTSDQLAIDSSPCTKSAPVIDTSTGDRCDIIDPTDCLYPYPSDFFTKADATTSTGRRLNFKLLSMPITVPTLFAGRKYINPAEINTYDGFSPGSMMIVHIPGLTNDTALNNSGLVKDTNIGAYSANSQGAVVIDTTTGQRWPIWTEIGQGYSDAAIDKVDSIPESDVNLIIHPAKNLTDGHRYVVALRNLRDSTNHPIAASDGFRVFRDRLITSRSSIEGRRAHMEDIFSKLQSAGIQRSDLVVAWDFTVASTRSLSERILKIRNDAFAKLGDTTMGDSTIQGSSPTWHITSVTDMPTDPDTLRQVDGTIEVPCYLTSTGCATGGAFNYGSDGLPAQNGSSVQLARFRCTIPQSAVDGSGPIYMTMYGHGLFGSINEVGSRNVRQFGNENRMVVCGTNWSGMAQDGDFGPEDDTVTAAGVLADLSGMNKISDRLQQGYLDFMYLGRAMAHPSGLTTDSAFSVSKDGNSASYNTGYVTYYGNSQGGIAGGGLTAVSPDITRSVLYVGAMNYSMLLPRSVDFDDFKPYFYPVYTKLSQRPLLFALMQLSWDRGEPNGYANHITSNPLPDTPVHHVTMEMSYGDHQVTNIATLVEARTLGLKYRGPWLDAGRDTNGAVSPWGLSTLGGMPLDDNALVTWDIGPLRYPTDPSGCRVKSSQTFCGVPSPPAGNVPNREGGDPHDHNIRTMATLRKQIGDYIKPGGHLTEVCGVLPCYGGGWTGN